MKIKSLEKKLLKTSQIEDGDVILIKINSEKKKDLTPDQIKSFYNDMKMLVKKDVPIVFFPDYLDVEIIKKLITEQKIHEN
jgi:hypothetical protein